MVPHKVIGEGFDMIVFNWGPVGPSKDLSKVKPDGHCDEQEHFVNKHPRSLMGGTPIEVSELIPEASGLSIEEETRADRQGF
jgi:hypothetical protein